MRLTGVLAPLPTPFDEAGALDVMRSPRRAAALGGQRRSPASWCSGTNGEAGLLNDAEADR